MTLGDDIRVLKNVDVMMVCDNIREAFNKFFDEDEEIGEETKKSSIEKELQRDHEN